MQTLIIANENLTPLRRIGLDDRDRLTIGRSTNRDLIIRDPDVSRLHCVLYREQDTWCIADAGSAGGTRVDGARVLWKRLRPGRIAEIGHLRLWVHEDTVQRGPETVADTLDLRVLDDRMFEPDGSVEGHLQAPAIGLITTAFVLEPANSADKTSVFLNSKGDFLACEDD